VADSFDGLNDYLAGLARRVEDPAALRPAYRQCEDIALAGMRQHFDQGVGPDGVPWQPLKRRKGRPLVKTGFLLASVTAQSGPAGLVLKAKAPYASYQHGGTRAIPARPFVGVSAVTTQRITAALERHVAILVGGGAPHGGFTG
jgi:phage gpG-like protein